MGSNKPRGSLAPPHEGDCTMRKFATNLFATIAALSISGTLFTSILV